MEFRNAQDFLKSKMLLTLWAYNTHENLLNMFFSRNSKSEKILVHLFVRARLI